MNADSLKLANIALILMLVVYPSVDWFIWKWLRKMLFTEHQDINSAMWFAFTPIIIFLLFGGLWASIVIQTSFLRWIVVGMAGLFWSFIGYGIYRSKQHQVVLFSLLLKWRVFKTKRRLDFTFTRIETRAKYRLWLVNMRRKFQCIIETIHLKVQ